MIVFVPGPMRNPLNGSRGHWSKHHRWAKDWRERTAQRLLVLKLTSGDQTLFNAPAIPKAITFTLNTVRRIDPDALPAICKPLLDACRDARIIDDDGPDRPHVVAYAQQIAPQERGVSIAIAFQFS